MDNNTKSWSFGLRIKDGVLPDFYYLGFITLLFVAYIPSIMEVKKLLLNKPEKFNYNPASVKLEDWSWREIQDRLRCLGQLYCYLLICLIMKSSFWFPVSRGTELFFLMQQQNQGNNNKQRHQQIKYTYLLIWNKQTTIILDGVCRCSGKRTDPNAGCVGQWGKMFLLNISLAYN